MTMSIGTGILVGSTFISRFRPSDLLVPGQLGVWYDTTDIGRMFQDTAGTIPVTSVNQLVARINPRAGTWPQLQQATLASQPIVAKDSSGRFNISFDTTDDILGTPTSVVMNQTDEVTIVTAMKFRSSTSNAYLLGVGGSTTSGSYYLTRGTAVNSQFIGVTRGSLLPATSASTSVGSYPGVQTLVNSSMSKISTDYSEIFVNGVSKGLSSGDMGTGALRSGAALVGKNFTSSLDANVYGLFAINRVLTSDEHLKVVNYFRWRMGI